MQRKHSVRWNVKLCALGALGLGWTALAATPRPSDAARPAFVQAAARAADQAAPRQTPEEVLAVVRRLFDAMREADSLKARTVFAEGARFASVSEGTGTQAIQYTTVDGFVASIGRPGRRLDERLFDVEVRVDDNVAVVWAPYTLYVDNQLRHCGTDLIDFLRVNGEWKITQIADTRRMEGCRQVPPGT